MTCFQMQSLTHVFQASDSDSSGDGTAAVSSQVQDVGIHDKGDSSGLNGKHVKVSEKRTSLTPISDSEPMDEDLNGWFAHAMNEVIKCFRRPPCKGGKEQPPIVPHAGLVAVRLPARRRKPWLPRRKRGD